MDARPAISAADRLAVLSVAHSATRPTEPIEHFQALRLNHPRRALATWWLLEEGGEGFEKGFPHGKRAKWRSVVLSGDLS